MKNLYDFEVTCDQSNNTTADIEANQLNIDIVVSLEPRFEYNSELWTREELYAEAHRLLDCVNELLTDSRKRCEAEMFRRAMAVI